MTAYARRLAARQPRMDREFGERVTIKPWLAGDMLAGAPDPATPSYELFGILDIPTRIQRVQGSAAVTGARADTIMQAVKFDFAASALGERPMPKEGWRLQAAEQAGEPVYVVKSVEPDGLGRVELSLIKA